MAEILTKPRIGVDLVRIMASGGNIRGDKGIYTMSSTMENFKRVLQDITPEELAKIQETARKIVDEAEKSAKKIIEELDKTLKNKKWIVN